MIKTKVALIGAGPVGLLGSLLLSQFQINHTCFQRFASPRSHPSAHWVSARSKQIISQIPWLTEKIDSIQQNFEHFRYYRYVERLFGEEFASTNHFAPSIQSKLNDSYKYFGQYPNHISQSKLLHLFYQHSKEKERIIFNKNITCIKHANNTYELLDEKMQKVCECDFVILCNGFNSQLRDNLQIKLSGKFDMYKIINIHFRSRKLATLIRQKSIEAMLFFLYNSQAPSVLVSHSLNQGEFVLQIPNYQPFVDLIQVYTPLQLIQMAIHPDYHSQLIDLQVIQVGKWKLQALLADQMTSGRIFLAGDTAHTYTPAGGFGMNSGFQDINHAVHAIHTILRNPKCNEPKIIDLYDSQRRHANKLYLEKSLANYEITQQMASNMGFPKELTSFYFKSSKFFPTPFFQYSPFKMTTLENLRLIAMKQLFRKRAVPCDLELFFDEFDFTVQNHSKIQSQIIEQRKAGVIYDAYVKENEENRKKVDELFGHLEDSNIKYCKDLPEGENIIGRDGIVLI